MTSDIGWQIEPISLPVAADTLRVEKGEGKRCRDGTRRGMGKSMAKRLQGMIVGGLALACGPVWAQETVLYCSEDQTVSLNGITPKTQRFVVKMDGEMVQIDNRQPEQELGFCKGSKGYERSLTCGLVGDGTFDYFPDSQKFYLMAKSGTGQNGPYRGVPTISQGVCADF